MFEKVIRKRICAQIRSELQHRSRFVPQTPKLREIYQGFQKPYFEWKEKEYEELAALMDISASSLRRLVGCRGYQNHQSFSPRNQTKIAQFLQYNSWQDLEQSILLEIIQKAANAWD